MKEAMRQRLQTLARALTKSNKTKVQSGKGCTDFTNIYMKDYTEAIEIKPGIKCSRAEAWVATKSLCAHEAGHILFTSKAVWNRYARWCQKEHPLPGAAITVLNIIEDARIERATALRYPETEKLFRFRNDYEYAHADNLGEGLRAFLNGLFCLAKVGDVPETLRNEEILDLLAECLVHVERGRLAGDTQVAADAAKEVLKIARPLMEKALEDLPEPSQPPAGHSPQEAPSGDMSGRKQAKSLKKRLKDKKKADASPEPDDKAKGASGSDEKPEEDAREEDDTEAEDSEDKDSEKTGSADDDSPLDDMPEGHGENEESPNESGDDPEPGEAGEKEPEDAAPESLPEDASEKDTDAADEDESDSPDDADSEPEDGEYDAGEEDWDTDEQEDEPAEEDDEEAAGDDDGDWPETEADDSPDDDGGEDADDEAGTDSPGDEEADKEETADEDVPEDDEDEPETGSPGAHGGSGAEDGDSDEHPNPDDAGHEESVDSYDAKELLRDAEDEIAAIDRRERERADKAEEVTAEDLSREIKWDVCHHGIAFESIRASSHGFAGGLKSRITPLAKKLAGEIQPLLLPKNNAPHRGQSKGRVDARALHKYPSGDKNLFYKKAEPSVAKDVAAYLLIDGSASMGHDGKYRKAREAAMLCHLALRNLRIVHAATLFTAAYRSGTVIHEEIVRFSESLAADNCDKFMAVRDIEDNRDGYSMRVAAKELLTRPEKKKLLFVLSDGVPMHAPREDEARHLTYHSMPAIMDTRRAVFEATKSGVLVIGVHFGRAPSEAHRLMYNNLVFSQTENLPAALGAAVRKALK
jgi:hypothetical protein